MIMMFPKFAVLVVGTCWLIGCKQDVVVLPCSEERAVEGAALEPVDTVNQVVDIGDKEIPEAWVRSTRVLGREGVIIPQVPREQDILDFETAISDIAKRSKPDQENRWVKKFYRQYQLLDPGTMLVSLFCEKPEGFGVKGWLQFDAYHCYCTIRFDLKTKTGDVIGCWEPPVQKPRTD